MPMFSSTTWTTLLRKVAGVARHVPVQVQATARPVHQIQGKLIAGGYARRARFALRKVIHETFPSLGTPSHHLAYAVQPIRINPTHARSRLGGSHSVRYGSTSAFRTAYKLPRGSPSGAAMPGQLGLGSARTFASGPASNVYATNVPIGFRAFVKLLKQDDEAEYRLPRPTRYRPYNKNKRTKRLTRRCSIPSQVSIDSSILSDLSHYLPFPRKIALSFNLPVCPEKLVTPGKTTVLSLPLSPDLHALLAPTTSVSYVEAELGVTVFASLCHGSLQLWEAFDLYRQERFNPLLAKLNGMGLLSNADISDVRTEGFVLRDAQGRPDIFKLVFHGRSVQDIHKLLGESLRAGEEGEWWALYEVDSNKPVELDPAESRAIMEDWADQPPRYSAPSPATAPEKSTVELIIPTLDMSVTHIPEDSWGSGQSSPMSDLVETPFERSPFSDSPLSDGYSTPGSDDSFPASLTASLLSQLSESSTTTWHINPSENDVEVESAVSVGSVDAVDLALSDEWTVADVYEEEERPPSPGAFTSWSGSGQGFGLAQPW